MFIPINHTPSLRRPANNNNSASNGPVNGPEPTPRAATEEAAPRRQRFSFPLSSPYVPPTPIVRDTQIPPWSIWTYSYYNGTDQASDFKTLDGSNDKEVAEKQHGSEEEGSEKFSAEDQEFVEVMDKEAKAQGFEAQDVEAQVSKEDDPLDRMSNTAVFVHTWASIIFPMCLGVLVLLLDSFGDRLAASILCICIATITVFVSSVMIFLEFRVKDDDIGIKKYIVARQTMSNKNKSKLKRRVITVGGGVVLILLCLAHIGVKSWQVSLLIDARKEFPSAPQPSSQPFPPIPLFTSPAEPTSLPSDQQSISEGLNGQ
ncbi:hypothetical protein L204_100215 [Cryptococcus depauperatus]|nr:hypothetical protein L204_02305 [Cryptococcus depauperatus CBS 7855]